MLYLPSDAFEIYVKETGATYNEDTGYLTISLENVCRLKSIFIELDGVSDLNMLNILCELILAS